MVARRRSSRSAYSLPFALVKVMVAADRVAEVDLAADHVVPVGSTRVLHVGQPHPRAGVEGVDRHLAVGGSGHLDAAVDQVGRGRSHAPVAVADLPGSPAGSRASRCATPRRDGSCGPARSSSRRATELALQRGEEVQSLGREDLLLSVDGRARDLNWGLSGHWSLLPWCRAAGTRERCPRARGRPRRPPARRCPGGSRRRGPRGRPPARRPGRRPTGRCSCC